jgi:hypothetical protein
MYLLNISNDIQKQFNIIPVKNTEKLDERSLDSNCSSLLEKSTFSTDINNINNNSNDLNITSETKEELPKIQYHRPNKNNEKLSKILNIGRNKNDTKNMRNKDPKQIQAKKLQLMSFNDIN